MKIIFVGTSELGLPSLEVLKDTHDIALIITRPDKPQGRKKLLTPPPVKVWAEKNNIPLAQPEKILNLKSEILNLNPDLILVASYGQIIPQEILDIPKFKSINIHPSLLPKYRGPSPIQNALLNDDKETGVTLIQMDAQMDHGPIIAQEPFTIDSTDTYQSLHDKLADEACKLLIHILPRWFNKSIKLNAQDDTQATFTQLLTVQDARINWSDDANNILNNIRALNPEPGTWTTLDGNNVKILKGTIYKDTKVELPGKLYKHEGKLAVKCRDHSLVIEKLLPAGKNEMTGNDLLNGLKNLETKLFI